MISVSSMRQFLVDSITTMLPSTIGSTLLRAVRNGASWRRGAQSGSTAAENTLRSAASSAVTGFGRAVVEVIADRILPGGRHIADIIMDGTIGALNQEPDVSPLRSGLVAATAAGVGAAIVMLPCPIISVPASIAASELIRRGHRALIFSNRLNEQPGIIAEMENAQTPHMIESDVEDEDFGSFCSLS